MLIQLHDIQKSFRNGTDGAIQEVLKGIDLSIERGEMVAIKGASGAGKSTLLHILGCLDQPDSGTYYLDGEDISKASLTHLAEIRNRKIGFVMQHFSLIEEDTVLQNVGVPLLFAKTKRLLVNGLAMAQLQQLGIEHLAQKKVNVLSGSEKQRVAIARALINQPDIILADEPTGALDTANSEKIMGIFEQLHQAGKTIIIVTHEAFVADCCTRVLTISDGKMA